MARWQDYKPYFKNKPMPPIEQYTLNQKLYLKEMEAVRPLTVDKQDWLELFGQTHTCDMCGEDFATWYLWRVHQDWTSYYCPNVPWTEDEQELEEFDFNSMVQEFKNQEKSRIQEFNLRFQVKEEFKVEGQHSENPSSVVDDDTAEPIKKIALTNEEFPLVDQPIVIDDIAFNILANTTEKTMEFLPEGIQLLKESDAGTDRKLEEPVPGLNEAEIIDVNHEENEDDKAGYKSNDEGSIKEDKTVKGEPD